MPHRKPFALCTLNIGTAAGKLLLHPPLHCIVQALRVPHEEHLHRARGVSERAAADFRGSQVPLGVKKFIYQKNSSDSLPLPHLRAKLIGQ